MKKLALVGRHASVAAVAAGIYKDNLPIDINMQQSRKVGKTVEIKRTSKHSLHKENKCDKQCAYCKLGK